MKAYVFEGDAEEIAIALQGVEVAREAQISSTTEEVAPIAWKPVECPECKRSFGSVHAMRIHKGHRHPTWQNKTEVVQTDVQPRESQPDHQTSEWSELFGEQLKIDSQLFGSVIDHVAKTNGRLRYQPDALLLGFESVSEWNEFVSKFMLSAPRISSRIGVSNKWKAERGASAAAELVYRG